MQLNILARVLIGAQSNYALYGAETKARELRSRRASLARGNATLEARRRVDVARRVASRTPARTCSSSRLEARSGSLSSGPVRQVYFQVKFK